MNDLEEVINYNATSQQQFIEKANRQTNPMASFSEFSKYSHDDLDVEIYCKRKCDMDTKVIKWAFKLAEKNVGPYYKTCSLGWQPKLKQSTLNKTWARYLVAVNKKTKSPVAYTMFRFDLDYGNSVIYCYEMQVEESSRRKGLGAFMLKALEKMAQHYEMEKLVLTVLKNNEDATRFYQKLGYVIDDSSPDKVEDVAYEIMSKTFI